MLGDQRGPKAVLRQEIVGDQHEREQLDGRIGNDRGNFSGRDRVANLLGPEMPCVHYELKKIDFAQVASR